MDTVCHDDSSDMNSIYDTKSPTSEQLMMALKHPPIQNVFLLYSDISMFRLPL